MSYVRSKSGVANPRFFDPFGSPTVFLYIRQFLISEFIFPLFLTYRDIDYKQRRKLIVSVIMILVKTIHIDMLYLGYSRY
jgi:hypothetical protein